MSDGDAQIVVSHGAFEREIVVREDLIDRYCHSSCVFGMGYEAPPEGECIGSAGSLFFDIWLAGSPGI